MPLSPLPSCNPSLDHAGVARSQTPRLRPSHTVSAPQVTLGLFRLREAQAERGPRAFAALAECCAPFEPGQRYQEFVRTMQPDAPPPPPPAFSFQEFSYRWIPRSSVGREPQRHIAKLLAPWD